MNSAYDSSGSHERKKATTFYNNVFSSTVHTPRFGQKVQSETSKLTGALVGAKVHEEPVCGEQLKEALQPLDTSSKSDQISSIFIVCRSFQTLFLRITTEIGSLLGIPCSVLPYLISWRLAESSKLKGRMLLVVASALLSTFEILGLQVDRIIQQK
ncbi:hypothetical protein H4Q26_002561 [Puccinia striiformis f. sp. tritici PST-130]|nr:hypothetical protein H4Q26_002561 [Puccinia striiformis f. sp. tritici PST-130]